jgi:hypothetical protein
VPTTNRGTFGGAKLMLALVGGVVIGGAGGFGAARARSSEDKALRRELGEVIAALREHDDARGPSWGPPAAATVAAFDAPALRAEISRIVREAIREGAPPAERAATPPRVEPTPDNFDALASGQQILDTALARKVWTQADGQDFKALLARVTPEQREELMTALLPALNRGDLKPDFAGPPL